MPWAWDSQLSSLGLSPVPDGAQGVGSKENAHSAADPGASSSGSFFRLQSIGKQTGNVHAESCDPGVRCWHSTKPRQDMLTVGFCVLMATRCP